jgi:uncharacterized protein YerC
MLELEQITLLLQDRQVKAVHERTGLSYSTIDAIKKGIDRKYNTSTLKVLSDYLVPKIEG